MLLCSFGWLSVTSHAISTHDLYITTLSILSYAKWDSNTSSRPILCVVDNPAIAQQFRQTIQQNKYNYQVSALSFEQLSRATCQAVFFSTLSAQEEQNAINNILKPPVLTFSSKNKQCEIGSAFCLYQHKQLTAFKVNLDSLGQSKVHVDPRVLLLAKTSER
ncbi:YfiR family protein [Acinetobacter larvae]|nr:YfiR family protein [Acinetobacter larvae]